MKKMNFLKPERLHSKINSNICLTSLTIPRRYTLTHSDFTGDLFLTIGRDYDSKKISGLKAKIVRDEVLAEWLILNDMPSLHVYCHVSGGFVLGKAEWRYNIFRKEMPLVLEAFQYGDRQLLKANQNWKNQK